MTDIGGIILLLTVVCTKFKVLRMILKYHNEDIFIILDGALYIGNTSGFNKVQFLQSTKKGKSFNCCRYRFYFVFMCI
jgi:hypothetical protein